MLSLEELKEKGQRTVKVLCKENVYHNFKEEDGVLFKMGELFIQRIDSNFIEFSLKVAHKMINSLGYINYDIFFHCDDVDYVKNDYGKYFETKEERRKRIIKEICQ